MEIDPKNAGAHYILGELARKNNNCEEADPHFAQATKLDVKFVEAYLGWGYCLTTQKEYDDAIAKLRAERLMPMNGSAHYALATALSFSGQKDEAQKEFALHRKLTAAAATARLPVALPSRATFRSQNSVFKLFQESSLWLQSRPQVQAGLS